MGGRGASVTHRMKEIKAGGKGALSGSTKKKTTEKKYVAGKTATERLVNFIKKQTNIDIDKYRDDATKRFDRPRSGYIIVDWKGMDRNTQNAILNLSHRYGGEFFGVEEAGAWMKGLRFKKRIKQRK